MCEDWGSCWFNTKGVSLPHRCMIKTTKKTEENDDTLIMIIVDFFSEWYMHYHYLWLVAIDTCLIVLSQIFILPAHSLCLSFLFLHSSVPSCQIEKKSGFLHYITLRCFLFGENFFIIRSFQVHFIVWCAWVNCNTRCCTTRELS